MRKAEAVARKLRQRLQQALKCVKSGRSGTPQSPGLTAAPDTTVQETHPDARGTATEACAIIIQDVHAHEARVVHA